MSAYVSDFCSGRVILKSILYDVYELAMLDARCKRQRLGFSIPCFRQFYRGMPIAYKSFRTGAPEWSEISRLLTGLLKISPY